MSFVLYTMVHIGTMNTMKKICALKISLKASSNSGGYYFMNILTGKWMHIYNWKELPKTEEIMEQVEKLAGDEGRPTMRYG